MNKNIVPGIDVPGIGVGGIIINNNKILLLKRKLEPEIDSWCYPGGRLEFGETLEDAVIREIKEEVNLKVIILKYIGYGNQITENYHWVNHTFITQVINGVEKNIDTAAHSDMQWFDINDLPENLMYVTKQTIHGLYRFVVNNGVYNDCY